jgi:hypothetical protein
VNAKIKGVKVATAGELQPDKRDDDGILALAEDAEDLAAFDERASEQSVAFPSIVRALKERGRL